MKIKHLLLLGIGFLQLIASAQGVIQPYAPPTTVVVQKYFGIVAPCSGNGGENGCVANLPGDSYTNTVTGDQYVCVAPKATQAPACTTVANPGWVKVNGGGGSSGTVPQLACSSMDGGMTYHCVGTPTQTEITNYGQWFSLTVDTVNSVSSPQFTVDSIGETYAFTDVNGNTIGAYTISSNQSYWGFFTNDSYTGFAVISPGGTRYQQVLEADPNSVLFTDSYTRLTDDAPNFQYDNVNHTLEIGGGVPIAPFEGLYVGPDESGLPANIQILSGSSIVVGTSTVALSVGSTNTAVFGITDGPISPTGGNLEAFVNEASQQAVGIQVIAGTDNVAANALYGIIIQPGDIFDFGGSTVNEYGLYVSTQLGGSGINNNILSQDDGSGNTLNVFEGGVQVGGGVPVSPNPFQLYVGGNESSIPMDFQSCEAPFVECLVYASGSNNGLSVEGIGNTGVNIFDDGEGAIGINVTSLVSSVYSDNTARAGYFQAGSDTVLTTNVLGVTIGSPDSVSGGTFTNAWGLQIGDQSNAIGNHWAIQTLGTTDLIEFSGPLQLDSLACPSGQTAPLSINDVGQVIAGSCS